MKEAHFRGLEVLTICKVAENLKQYLKDAHFLYYSINKIKVCKACELRLTALAKQAYFVVYI